MEGCNDLERMQRSEGSGVCERRVRGEIYLDEQGDGCITLDGPIERGVPGWNIGIKIEIEIEIDSEMEM